MAENFAIGQGQQQPVSKRKMVSEDDVDKVKDPGFFVHPAGHIRDRIILHESADAADAKPNGEFVALNGFPFQVAYNKPVDIPRPVFEMMKTLTKTIVQKDDEGNDVVRNIPRFSMTLVQADVGAT